MQVIIPSNSSKIIESKSMKLYLNLLNFTQFKNHELLQNTIKSDLEKRIESVIDVKIYDIDSENMWRLMNFQGISIDKLDYNSNFSAVVLEDDINRISDDYRDDHQLNKVQECLYSNLIRSHCPVTNQPDWGSIEIKYNGYKINHQAVLSYIIFLRSHSSFHETLTEEIFHHIISRCNPDSLSVYARYTRRGGVDINSIRLSHEILIDQINLHRNIRQ